MCVEALELAIKKIWCSEIMHTDRGRQFMGRRFQGILEEAGVKISVGERGYKDNILIERLFRSYKWECVYLRDRLNLKELKGITKEWVEYYNKEQKLIFFLSKDRGAFQSFSTIFVSFTLSPSFPDVQENE